LKCFSADAKLWHEVNLNQASGAFALGETAQNIIVALNTDPVEYVTLDPFSRQIQIQSAEQPPDVRWVGGWKNHEYTNFAVNQHGLRFNSSTGAITDKEMNQFHPVFDVLDNRNQNRFIAYPGLGLGIGNERKWELDIVQLGYAGRDVRTIELLPGGFIWAGGQNLDEYTGLNLFDRQTGQWQYFDSDMINKLDSDNVRDIAFCGNRVFFATDEGLAVLSLKRGRKWKTLDRFDGLSGIDLNAVGCTSGKLYSGGRDGLDEIQLADKNYTVSTDNITKDLFVFDLATDADTVWAGTMTGLYKSSGDGWQAIDLVSLPSLNSRIETIEVADNYIWIGAPGGVGELDRRTNIWKQYPANVYLNGATPRCFTTNDSILWVGSSKGLFAKHTRKNFWSKFGKAHGLPSSRINALKVEADTLWIGTDEGLTRFIWRNPDRYKY
jgi:hypothetical protein